MIHRLQFPCRRQEKRENGRRSKAINYFGAEVDYAQLTTIPGNSVSTFQLPLLRLSGRSSLNRLALHAIAGARIAQLTVMLGGRGLVDRDEEEERPIQQLIEIPGNALGLSSRRPPPAQNASQMAPSDLPRGKALRRAAHHSATRKRRSGDASGCHSDTRRAGRLICKKRWILRLPYVELSACERAIEVRKIKEIKQVEAEKVFKGKMREEEREREG